MKVLMVGNDHSVKGGITSVITQLLSHDWDQNDIQMDFIPTYVETGAVKKIVFFANAYLKIRKYIITDHPDVVHIHMSYKGSFVRANLLFKLCRRYSIPVIVHLHGSEFSKWYNSSNKRQKEKVRLFLRQVSVLIVLGNKWNAEIEKIEPQTKTVVVSNSVDIPKASVHWNDKKIQFLFLGVLIPRKGVFDLLNAAAKVKRISNKPIKYVIAGTGVEEEKLKTQTDALGLDDTVKFAGWTTGKKKRKLIQESQVMVLPSYNEGLPISILEGISYGMPVIATNVGDINAAVHDGDNGFLVRCGDIDQLAEKIIEVADKDIFSKMSIESKFLAKEKFSEKHYFESIKEIYEEVVNERR